MRLTEDNECKAVRLAGEDAFSVPSRSLNRTALESFLLISIDIFSILAWSGMLVYAMYLWHYRNQMIQDIPFSVETLLALATV